MLRTVLMPHSSRPAVLWRLSHLEDPPPRKFDSSLVHFCKRHECKLTTSARKPIRDCLPLLLSALCYWLLESNFNFECLCGIPIALVALAITLTFLPLNSDEATINPSPVVVILSLLNALGVVLAAWPHFVADAERTNYLGRIRTLLGVPAERFYPVLGTLLAAGALFAVAEFTLYIWKHCQRTLAPAFRGMEKRSLVVLTVLLTSFGIAIAFVYAQSNAFYGSEHIFDVVYYCDSSALFNSNVYLRLLSSENDLRQPLFAVFASPFLGISELMGQLAGSVWIRATLYAWVQLAMLAVAFRALACALFEEERHRAYFEIAGMLAYGSLLYSFVAEQYVVAFFWMSLLVAQSARKDDDSIITAYIGATSTLLTSGVGAIFPLLGQKTSKITRLEFRKALIAPFTFLWSLLVFCRFDIIFNVIQQVQYMLNFTGASVPLLHRIYLFGHFVHDCLFAPTGMVVLLDDGSAVWRMGYSKFFCLLGLGVAVVASFGFCLNARKRIAGIAFLWMLMSIALLVGLGWGVSEEGLIIYSLYFGWAYLALLFAFVQQLEQRLGSSHMVDIVSVVLIAALALINIPAMYQLISFALDYYPLGM